MAPFVSKKNCAHHYIPFKINFNIILPSLPFGSLTTILMHIFVALMNPTNISYIITLYLIILTMWAIFMFSREEAQSV
jgi:hypothetical protein